MWAFSRHAQDLYWTLLVLSHLGLVTHALSYLWWTPESYVFNLGCDRVLECQSHFRTMISDKHTKFPGW
jgi:hypothetical protein